MPCQQIPFLQFELVDLFLLKFISTVLYCFGSDKTIFIHKKSKMTARKAAKMQDGGYLTSDDVITDLLNIYYIELN